MLLRGKQLRRTITDGMQWSFLLLCCFISIGLFAGISFCLIREGLPEFFKGISAWHYLKEYFINTLWLLALTLPAAGILGVAGAVYLEEYAKNETVTSVIQFAIEILAGIPSIVFGLFGMVFFGELLHLGYSLLTGSLTLILMILPLMLENTREILKTIPKEYRLGALGLGAGKWQMLWTVLLPEAVPGILAGFTVSTGKILGESAALLFTAGSRGSLSVALYRMIGKGQIEECYQIALILLFLMILLNLFFQYIREQR